MKNILNLFVFLIVITGVSQTLTIKDKTNNEPIELATIISYKPYVYTVTNAQGQANIKDFKKSEKIEISMLGYSTAYISFENLKKQDFVYLMEPTTLNMDEIVVSATKWKQSSDDIPSKIISYNLNEVLLNNPQTAADLLGKTGKVFVQKSQQGGGSPMIRGFATNRLLYSIDGVRMNTAIFRGGNLQNVISLDPFAIEITEVLFGPGSVIYGSDAIGGVMSFLTHTSQLSSGNDIITSGSALLRYASANKENTGHFHLNYGGNKWAGVSNLSFNLYEDLKMGSNGPDDYLRSYFVIRENGIDIVKENMDTRIQTPSGYKQYNLMQKIRFQPNDKIDFNYGFHYSTTTEYSRYDYHLRKKNDKPRYGEWNYGPQKWMMNLFNINLISHESWFDFMDLKVAHQFFEESRISRNFNKPNREIRVEKVNAYSANFDFQKGFGEKNQLMYGFEYFYDNVNSSGTDENIESGTKSKGPARYPMSNWTSMAAYISDNYKLSSSFNILSGIRYNQYIIDATFDTTFYPFPFTDTHLSNGALSGSLGFVYKPTNFFELSFNTSTAFRSPNIDDIGKVFDSEPGSVVVPNPDLEAEYAYNLDLGFAFLLSNKFKIDLSGYYTYLDNALVRRAFTLNGQSQIMYDGELSDVLAMQNAAKATVYGVQGGLEVKLPSGFGYEFIANYQKGEEELDNGDKSPSRHAAPFFASTGFNYKKKKLDFKINLIYNGEKSFDQLPEEEKSKDYMYALDDNDNPFSPSWYTLNFTGQYQITKKIVFATGVENITDQRYRPYSSGISAPGRNIIVSLRSSF